MSKLSQTQAWNHLKRHLFEIEEDTIFKYFKLDKQRHDKFSISFDDIYFDFSKNKINEETMSLLVELVKERHLRNSIDKMFAGEKINFTEKRAALHTLLRASDTSLFKHIPDIDNVFEKVQAVKNKMKNFVESIHTGKHTGYTGQKIKDIVNIGIGGSDLGPRMICKALEFYKVESINVHFISNIDVTELVQLFSKINPETTLFIIASKTFTTLETIQNAETAKKWILEKGVPSDDIKKHFVALSTNIEKCKEFGIDEHNIFEFWDWVGGRYSLWSAIGLSVALYISWENFENLLKGAEKVDHHFTKAPFGENIPVILALIEIWNINFLNHKSRAIIPYDQNLEKFPDFLQQLEMESNGKTVDKSADFIDYHTAPVVFGRIGTDSQHSFFQLIHQGSEIIPVDFIAFKKSLYPEENIHHNILLSNCLAQSRALLEGKTYADVVLDMIAQKSEKEEINQLGPSRVFKGNRPSNTIIIDKLTPESIGKLIAIYEHKVFVESIIWNIDAFDQWGVELGKQLAKPILAKLLDQSDDDDNKEGFDCSTLGLINHIKK